MGEQAQPLFLPDQPSKEASAHSKISGWEQLLKKMEQLGRDGLKLERCKTEEGEALGERRRRGFRDEDVGVGADPRLRWKGVYKSALMEGEILPIPPEFRLGGNLRGNDPMEWEIIKGIRQSIKENGLNSPLTKSFLDYIFTFHSFTPQDTKVLMSLILTDSQQLMWESQWQSSCSAAAGSGWAGQDPRSWASPEMLTGRGEFADWQKQARLHPAILWQSQQLARDALEKVPEDGERVPAYSRVKQGYEEPFGQFVERLRAVLEKTHLEEFTKTVILKTFVIQNANPACRRIVGGLSGAASIEKMIEACEVARAEEKAKIWGSAVAAAIKPLLEISPKCHSCGQPGHLKAECKTQKGKGGGTGRCRRCQKWGHRARECRSKFRRDGSPILEN